MSHLRTDELALLSPLDRKIVAVVVERMRRACSALPIKPFMKLAKPSAQGRHFFNGTHLVSWVCDCDYCFDDNDVSSSADQHCLSLAKFRQVTRKGKQGARSHLTFTLRETDVAAMRASLYSATDRAKHTPNIDVRSPKQRAKDKRKRQERRSQHTRLKKRTTQSDS